MPLLKPTRGIQLNRNHPLARGLVGYWLLNEGTGRMVFDLSGNNAVGQLQGDPSWTAGRFGSTLDFDGSGDFITVENYTKADISVKTISAWINSRDLTTWDRIVGMPNTATNKWTIVIYNNGIGYDDNAANNMAVSTNILLTNTWSHIAVVDNGTIGETKIYLDGVLQSVTEEVNNCGVGGSQLCIGARTTQTANYFNGFIDNVMIFDRILSAAEIAHLYREPFCMFERQVSPTYLFVPIIDLAGTSTAQSTTFATAKLIRRISGSSAAVANITALLKIIGEVLLTGSTETSSVLSGKLTLSYRGPWLSSPLKIERQWLTDVLFNGMTANAFKLGTVLLNGWFWMRLTGCSALYRGPTMEQIDFANLLAVTEQDADSILLPSYVPHRINSTYFYIVRRFNYCGYQEQTLQAAVKVAIDADGNLAEPLPNNIFDWRAEQIDGNKIQLVWFYSPLEQKSKPVRFKIYYDGGIGQIDYENPIAEISYRGRKFYSWQSEALPGNKYLFAVKAEDITGIENNSLEQLAIDIVGDGPDEIEILKVETL
jgi:hypothetical protein